jgi:hypothetical protein
MKIKSGNYDQLRREIQKEINAQVLNPRPSAERWKKSELEKFELAKLKLSHRQAVERAGYDPKIRMNTFEPIRAKVW